MVKWQDMLAHVALRLVAVLLYGALGILVDAQLLDGQAAEHLQGALAEVAKFGS